MLEVAVEALQQVLMPERLMFLVIGVLGGIVIGILPGLGGTAGLAILLPFIYGMDLYSGMGLLIGMAAVTTTSDTFPSVLMGVPGTAGSQATVMDGYPLAKKGEGARALGAGFSASMLGGIFGAVALLGLIGAARPIILAFGSPELFMLVLLGLTTVALVSRPSMLKGLIVGFGGLLLGSIGAAPAAPTTRFAFGQIYLYNGLSIVVITLGLFAVPELLKLMTGGQSIAGGVKPTGRLLDGIKDTLRHPFIVLRNSVLGVGMGMIPGLGGSVIDWMSYGLTQQTVKDNQNFGKGDIRGVIAPESSNNAKEGGTLVPTLLFGIPGSGSMAVFLGGLVLLGLTPGPALLQDNLSLTVSIVWSLAIANILATAVCLAIAKYAARITLIPGRQLAPVLLVVILGVAFQTSRMWGDVIGVLALGLLGLAMMQGGWPRVPMLIGFILANGAERYLGLAVSRYGFEWFTRPGVIIIGTITLLVLVLGQIRRVDRPTARSGAGADEAAGGRAGGGRA